MGSAKLIQIVDQFARSLVTFAWIFCQQFPDACSKLIGDGRIELLQIGRRGLDVSKFDRSG
jgi:hypothetical protein